MQCAGTAAEWTHSVGVQWDRDREHTLETEQAADN